MPHAPPSLGCQAGGSWLIARQCVPSVAALFACLRPSAGRSSAQCRLDSALMPLCLFISITNIRSNRPISEYQNVPTCLLLIRYVLRSAPAAVSERGGGAVGGIILRPHYFLFASWRRHIYSRRAQNLRVAGAGSARPPQCAFCAFYQVEFCSRRSIIPTRSATAPVKAILHFHPAR